jgi:tRNA/rRNA methyltransferase
LLLELLTASGYTGPRSEAKGEEKIRRLIRRLTLSPDDAETWLGMLRQILWKLRASQPT